MNIDNVFSPVRTGWLIRKYIKENHIPLLFTTVVMFLISITNGLAYMYSKGDGVDEQILFMLIAFFLCGCVTASIAFKQIWDTKSAVTLLMTPVSAFEQFLVRWIWIAVDILWTLISAVAADAFKYLFINYLLGGNIEMIPWCSMFLSSEGLFNLYIVFLLFIFVQSFFFLGSVVWRKNSFVKTFFVMGLVFMVYIIAASIVVNSHFSSTSSSYMIVDISEMDYLTFVPMQILLWIGAVINYILTVMRLREAEIIHRW